MDKYKWGNYITIRDKFRVYVQELALSLPYLGDVQQEFVNNRADNKSSVYKVETPVVYNTALDDITIDDEIKLILVADNPGRREQMAENRRYLVGPSGKIAQKFFRDNPSLEIDFLKNVIILNKTPIHSPRTVDLRELCRLEGYAEFNLAETQRIHPAPKFLGAGQGERKGNSKALPHPLITALENSQRIMARLLFQFQEALGCPVWITGYSEMRKNGLFEVYTETLKELYSKQKDMFKEIFIFRHFSMNQFTIDLKQQAQTGESVTKSLKRIGTAYRKRILG